MFDNLVTTVKWLTIPTVVVAALLIWVVPNLDPFNFGGRIATILNPAIRQAFALVASVGEQEPAPWSFMYVNTLIALLLVVPGVYFCLRRGNKDDILMIVFALTLLYFTGSMVRIVLVLAPALALLGGYALANILKYFGGINAKREKYYPPAKTSSETYHQPGGRRYSFLFNGLFVIRSSK